MSSYAISLLNDAAKYNSYYVIHVHGLLFLALADGDNGLNGHGLVTASLEKPPTGKCT